MGYKDGKAFISSTPWFTVNLFVCIVSIFWVNSRCRYNSVKSFLDKKLFSASFRLYLKVKKDQIFLFFLLLFCANKVKVKEIDAFI